MDADRADFNYYLSKEKYMANVKKCFDEDSKHWEATIRSTIELLKSSDKTPLHKYYEIASVNGCEILTEKRKTETDSQVQVLCFEDIFDIFIKKHISNNHQGGRRYLTSVEKQLNASYNYPSVCLSLLVKSCNVCRSRIPIPAKTCTKIGSVYTTVMLQQSKYNYWKNLLIYIDKFTDFVVIRPLSQKSDIEVAMEIFKILMQFGPPQKLCMHGHNKDYNKKVGSYLRQVCPMFTFSIEYRSANLDPSAYVVNKLQQWMCKTGSFSWEIGCSVVQKELNSVRLKSRQAEEIQNVTPYSLLFGRVSPKPTSKEKKHQVYEMKFKAKATRDACTSTTPQIESSEDLALEGEVVELRIPNTEDFNVDLLSQFEDSEASQEYPRQPEEIKSEPEEMVIDENEIKTEEPVLQPSNVIRLCKEDEKEDDNELCLDLEVDVDQSSEEEEEMEPIEPDYPKDTNKRRSLRLAKQSGPGPTKVTEWIEDKGEEVVVEDVLDINKDPLNMD